MDPVYRIDDVSQIISPGLVVFRDLVIAAKPVNPPPEAAARVLSAEVLAGRLPLPKWDHSVTQWILRLNLLAEKCPELALPAIGDDDRRHIVEQICHGASSYKELKQREVKSAVVSWLAPEQSKLVDKHAPDEDGIGARCRRLEPKLGQSFENGLIDFTPRRGWSGLELERIAGESRRQKDGEERGRNQCGAQRKGR